ncbi:MAG: CoA pyrophosphatase [Anaerolineae bacterium]|nr:CoA pyrophosphatase [Anaerolineae bacterium]
MVEPEEEKQGLYHLKSAAVLVPILFFNGEWCLLFTRRSNRLRKHSGQVAFPGGSSDETDLNPAATALREAHEEIALPDSHVKILGYMHPFEANSGFSVTPVVGWIHTPFQVVPSEDEVARVFSVPLTWFLTDGHLQYRTVETPWERREKVIFYEPYDGELVWGFTGWITRDFMDIVKAV